MTLGWEFKVESVQIAKNTEKARGRGWAAILLGKQGKNKVS